jgi:hypothetical protein
VQRAARQVDQIPGVHVESAVGPELDRIGRDAAPGIGELGGVGDVPALLAEQLHHDQVVIVVVHRCAHAAHAPERRRGHRLVEQHLERARQAVELRPQRTQLREAHRVVTGVELRDAGAEVVGVRDPLERGRGPERVGGMEGQLGSELEGGAEHRARIGAKQRHALGGPGAVELVQAAAERAVEELIESEWRQQPLQRALRLG